MAQDLDLMAEAIALSSPSGRMSKRAKDAAIKRLDRRLDEERLSSEHSDHSDNCECDDCEKEKRYLINLICSSVEDLDEYTEQTTHKELDIDEI